MDSPRSLGLRAELPLDLAGSPSTDSNQKPTRDLSTNKSGQPPTIRRAQSSPRPRLVRSSVRRPVDGQNPFKVTERSPLLSRMGVDGSESQPPRDPLLTQRSEDSIELPDLIELPCPSDLPSPSKARELIEKQSELSRPQTLFDEATFQQLRQDLMKARQPSQRPARSGSDGPTGIGQPRLEASKEHHYVPFGHSYLYAARREGDKEQTGHFEEQDQAYTTESGKLSQEKYLTRSEVTRSQSLAKSETRMAHRLQRAQVAVTAPMHKFFPRTAGARYGRAEPVDDLLVPEKTVANDYAGGQLGATERTIPSVPGVGGDSLAGLGMQFVGNLTNPMEGALASSGLVKLKNTRDAAINDLLRHYRNALRFYWHLDRATDEEAESFLKFVDACQRLVPLELDGLGMRAVRIGNWTAEAVSRYTAVKAYAGAPISVGSTATVIATLATSINSLPVGDVFSIPLGVAVGAFDAFQGHKELVQQRDKNAVARVRQDNLAAIMRMSSMLGGAAKSLHAHQDRLIRQAKREGGIAIARIGKGIAHSPLAVAGGTAAMLALLAGGSLVTVGGIYFGLGLLGMTFMGVGLYRNQKRVWAEHNRKWRQRAAQAFICQIPPHVLESWMGMKNPVPFEVSFEEGEYLPAELRFKGEHATVIDVQQNEYIGLHVMATRVRDCLVYPQGRSPVQDELINLLLCLGISELEQEAICRVARTKKKDAQIDFIQARLAPAFGIKFVAPAGRASVIHPSIFLNAFKSALKLCWREGDDLPAVLHREKAEADALVEKLNGENASVESSSQESGTEQAVWEDLRKGMGKEVSAALDQITGSSASRYARIEQYMSLTFQGSINWKEELRRSIGDFLDRTNDLEDAEHIGIESDHALFCNLLQEFSIHLILSDGEDENAGARSNAQKVARNISVSPSTRGIDSDTSSSDAMPPLLSRGRTSPFLIEAPTKPSQTRSPRQKMLARTARSPSLQPPRGVTRDTAPLNRPSMLSNDGAPPRRLVSIRPENSSDEQESPRLPSAQGPLMPPRIESTRRKELQRTVRSTRGASLQSPRRNRAIAANQQYLDKFSEAWLRTYGPSGKKDSPNKDKADTVGFYHQVGIQMAEILPGKAQAKGDFLAFAEGILTAGAPSSALWDNVRMFVAAEELIAQAGDPPHPSVSGISGARMVKLLQPLAASNSSPLALYKLIQQQANEIMNAQGLPSDPATDIGPYLCFARAYVSRLKNSSDRELAPLGISKLQLGQLEELLRGAIMYQQELVSLDSP
ncbi:hypothetical protein [Variovorax sp. PBL-E5]|uniref:hypothetical protein n=1 Tax=Variovorax sp. PBL-E5 TaxID=434014 RepID=UPI001E4117EE|nr:hypothetical protein [Variovorax sp. PBL-E5]